MASVSLALWPHPPPYITLTPRNRAMRGRIYGRNLRPSFQLNAVEINESNAIAAKSIDSAVKLQLTTYNYSLTKRFRPPLSHGARSHFFNRVVRPLRVFFVTPAVKDALRLPDAVLEPPLFLLLFPVVPRVLALPLKALLDTTAASPVPVIVVWLPSRVTPSH